MSSFVDQMTVACSTKRAVITAGKRPPPTANLSGLYCAPLLPVDAELATRAGLSTPLSIWQTFLNGNPDIKAGDVLVISSNEYPIRAAWDYSAWDGLDDEDDDWMWLILEEVKSS
jgi:hypothetical protein